LTHVTKVLPSRRVLRLLLPLAVYLGAAIPVSAQNQPQKPAEELYLQLGRVGLDPTRVYQVRGAALNRSSIQLSFEDGTIAFTQDVMGRITGAFFAGDGEILLPPPNEAERQSMSLFTGIAILEERFSTAYLRFNDDVANELAPDLRPTNEDKQAFVDRWGMTAKNLASLDAMRLLLTFSQMLPEAGSAVSEAARATNPDRCLHARLQGNTLGVFDAYFDSTAGEQILAGQSKGAENGETYYDVWTSFSPIQGRPRASQHATQQPQSEEVQEGRIALRHFTIETDVLPPKKIHARARIECEVQQGGARALLFELSRFLQVESVTLDGRPVEFIHNPALEGTQISRRGNDTLAVLLPETARTGQKFTLEFVYGGEVLADAGTGLLYVGERGTWYPNRGLEMANFDLQFTYPAEWTLVATGKPASVSSAQAASTADRQTSRWVSERPIPIAGFNLGKYKEVTAQAGSVRVETYATRGVERDFPSPPVEIVQARPSDPIGFEPKVILPSRPSPTQTELAVAESAARAIQYFSERFGPFPYSQLSLTQIPGRESQGWPGLIFLSSYAFLTAEQRQQLHYSPDHILVQESIPAHETAHQWWGDLVTWKSYRDQWFSEGLANYCALMMLQENNPVGFRQVMDTYRSALIEKNKDGMDPREAGPVTLGTRLLSSKFPQGYEAISYGRATWLFHMLRTMMKDAAATTGSRNAPGNAAADEPFLTALRQVRERYEGKAISTRELLSVFAEHLPTSLRYEGKSSLDWFLDGWINGTSLPKLNLKAVRFLPKGAGVTVSGMILQKEAPQDLVTSVPVYAVTTGRQPLLLGRVFADGEESSFRLTAPAGTHKILLDPYGTILSSPK
jgi:hypothetical protein